MHKNKVAEYWDTMGLIKSGADAEVEFVRYLSTPFEDGENGTELTLSDFEDYINDLNKSKQG